MSLLLERPQTTIEVDDFDFEADILDHVLKPSERVALATTKRFKDTNDLWNDKNHNSRARCGAVMDMIKDLPEDGKINDWYYFYIDDFGAEEFWKNVDDWYMDLGSKDWGFAVNSYCRRVLDDAFRGAAGERLALKALRADKFWRGYKFRLASAEEDGDFGVDIIATLNGKITHGFQVKPPSYFAKTKYESILKARTVTNPAKYRKFVAVNKGAEARYINLADVESLAQGGKVKSIPVGDVAAGRYTG